MTTLLHILRKLVATLALSACAATIAQAAAPACVDPGGIGGSGAPAREGGIGGTGAPAAANEGGFGGTGNMARSGVGGTGAPAGEGGFGGTGIVGTITGFASICVNGVEVHYEDTVPVTENGIGSATARLAVGQVVAVEAGTSERGLEARNISILNAYEGPLTALPDAASPLRVMGQAVRIATDARVDPGLRVGEPVRVSGMRGADGAVVATRIERAPGLREASAIGGIERQDSLQGLPLAGSSPTEGRELLVRGAWTGKALQVTQAHQDPVIPFAGRVRNALIEGFVLDRLDKRVMIGAFAVELDDATAFAGGNVDELGTNRRVRVHGIFSGTREVKATRIEFMRDGAQAQGGQRGTSGSKSATGHKDDEDADDRARSGKARTDVDDGRVRIETEDKNGRERIERDLSATGEIERERIERRMESPDGELLRREHLETRTSGDRVETRERIETFDKGVRVERIERTERTGTPERIDRPARIEKLEKIERRNRD